MATHSSILAWRIPWIGEPGGLQFTGSQGVGHDWATNTQTHAHTYTQVVVWIRKWQPTPVLLPGESQGLRSLPGYSPWGHKELDTTEVTEHNHGWGLTLPLSCFDILDNWSIRVSHLKHEDRQDFCFPVPSGQRHWLKFSGCFNVLFQSVTINFIAKTQHCQYLFECY